MDVKKILHHFGVGFVETHPSVGKGSVGIDCPFCSDNNKHLGIFLDYGNYHCWKCNSKGSLFKLLRHLKGIRYDEFVEISGNKVSPGENSRTALDRIYKVGQEEGKKKQTNVEEIRETLRPIKKYLHLNTALKKFIEVKGLYTELLDWYGCSFAPVGPMKDRLIMPYPNPALGEETTAYIGRTIHRTTKPKYLISEGFERVHEVYLNQATEKHGSLVLVEGIFDTWAFKIPAAALLGKTIALGQINKILKMEVDHIIVCLDGDAPIETLQMRRTLLPYFSKVDTLLLKEDEDPWSLGYSGLAQLLKGCLHGAHEDGSTTTVKR